jgi:acetylornithine deacetylase
MMAALCRLAKERKRPAHTEVTLVGVIDEENAQAGSRALAASKLKPDLAIVGEPTRLQVVTAHKGSVWLRLETRGKSAHGACPNLGRNAVHAMSRIVDLLEGKYAARLRSKRHPLLGSPTISVGVIAGGTQPNIVPDSCRIDVDRRTLPGETEAGIKRELQALLRSNHMRAVYSSFKLAPCLPLETNPKHPLVAQFLESVGQKKAAGVHYFCDASVLAHGGIPSVVFGPGDIAQAHTADEWISLSALERGSALLLRFLQSLP